MNLDKTIFEKIIDREIQAEIIEETDNIIVIKDINPQAPIHLLIILKKKIVNLSEINDEDCIYGNFVFKMAKKLSRIIPGAKDFKLVINNGKDAGQCIFQFHAHFLAGFEKF